MFQEESLTKNKASKIKPSQESTASNTASHTNNIKETRTHMKERNTQKGRNTQNKEKQLLQG
jgi:hypothetical protein